MRKIDHNKNKPNKLRYYKNDGKINKKPHFEKELHENISSYLKNPNSKLNFGYYKYLKNEIINLTDGRCAYCGKFVDTLSIEHYHPKDGIAIDINTPKSISKPGYFWLASDWYNLFPACTTCNILKKREIINLNNLEFYSNVVGKGNLFPLYKNYSHSPLLLKDKGFTYCSKRIKKEKPLLFNPSKNNPKKLFKYELTRVGKYKGIIIRPKTNENIYLQEIAKTTIEILGLNSKLHIRERYVEYNNMKSNLENIFEINDLDDEDSQELLRDIFESVDESSCTSYLGMIETMFWDKLCVLLSMICKHNNVPFVKPNNLKQISCMYKKTFPELYI